MADSIARLLSDDPCRRPVLHLAGFFHVKRRLGIAEHLRVLAPSAEVLTVVAVPSEQTEDAFEAEEHQGIADYVVLTDISNLEEGG